MAEVREKGSMDKGALWSLLLGLLFLFPLLNFLFGTLAIYLGLESLKNGRGQQMGAARAFATAGILLGALPFYFGVIAVARWLLKLENAAVAGITIATLPALLAVLLAALKMKRLI